MHDQLVKEFENEYQIFYKEKTNNKYIKFLENKVAVLTGLIQSNAGNVREVDL